MYPCSNLELLEAVARNGGMAVVQPLSLIYAHEQELRPSLQRLRKHGSYGFNVLTEASSQIYLDRMRRWVDVALEEGCRFFVSALGNPRWIVERVQSSGAKVFHDCTELKWAQKALDSGVHGLICVNNRAGGHAGRFSSAELLDQLKPLSVPLICAGGVGNASDIRQAIDAGYAGVQMGTRFIATQECSASEAYKQAIVRATENDVGLTERITGVPVAVILTDEVKRQGTRAGWLMRKILSHPKLKHWGRLWYSLLSFRKLKKSLRGHTDYWQAGKSVSTIDDVPSVDELFQRWTEFQAKDR
jgi:nitronate monooxygenase